MLGRIQAPSKTRKELRKIVLIFDAMLKLVESHSPNFVALDLNYGSSWMFLLIFELSRCCRLSICTVFTVPEK